MGGHNLLWRSWARSAALLARFLRATAIGGLICLAGTAAYAGPALLPEADPKFNDPLAKIRPTEAEIAPATSPNDLPPRIVNQDAGAFTIIGNPEAGELEQPGETDDLTEIVRDEFLGQSGNADTPEEAADSAAGVENAESSTANLVRALVNTVPGEGGGNTGGDTAQQAGGPGLIGSVIDATLIDLISTMLNPKLEADGMVTFSIAGFGEFALLLLQESGGLFIVDLESGTAVKFSEGTSVSDAGRISRQQQGAGAENRGTSNALQRLLEILERNVVPIVTSPITLATIVLFSMIWIVWRISASRE